MFIIIETVKILTNIMEDPFRTPQKRFYLDFERRRIEQNKQEKKRRELEYYYRHRELILLRLSMPVNAEGLTRRQLYYQENKDELKRKKRERYALSKKAKQVVYMTSQ